MPTSLLDDIARRLDASPEEARQALRALRRELLAEAEEAGQAHAPGLGVFRLHNGSLRLEPGEALARMVNHRFAGLDPISVEAPAAVPAHADKQEADTGPAEAPAQHEPLPSNEDHALDSQAEHLHEEAGHATPDEGSPEKRLISSYSRTPYSVIPTGLFANQQLVESDFVGARLLPMEAPAEDQAPDVSASPPVRDRSPAPSPAAERRRPAILPWAAALLLLLLVGAGLWYVLGQQDPVGDSSDDVAATADNPSATAEQAATSEEATPAAGAAPAEREETDAEELAPAGIERTPGTWTIVLSSETERATAETIQQDFRRRLSDLSYSVGILEATAEGVTRYRVAVGQFASLAEAQDALRRAAERLPQGAWLLEIESDT